MIHNISRFIAALALLATAQTVWADDVAYLDANGAQQTCSTYTTVTNSSTSWSGGWYVVSSSTTIADRITVSGTVNLILCDGATLTASKGITVGSSATFNIYAQTNDEATMGALVADGTNDKPNWYAGIGGVENTDAGMITINGGQINATGWCAAGIGSGGGTSTVGTITINGGIVTAQDNAHYGAGIGGGFSGGKAGTINLNGGVINAAGIGSGYMGGDCSITVNISDGVKKIVATPVQGGACIGKGKSASGSVTVNFISGGNIVTGDAKDAVFYDTGEGAQRQVRAKAMNHAVTMSDDLKANITATSEYAFTGETVTLTLGTAVDATTLSVNDGAVATTDAGNRQYTFTMPDGDVTVTATLLQTYAVSLPANMEVVSATNAADADGKYITGTTVTFKASFPYAASNVSDGTSTLEPDANGIYTVTVADADVTITATVERSATIDLTDAPGDFNAIEGDVLTGTTSHTVTIAADAGITLSGATISGGIVCEGTATITLVGTNSVNVNNVSASSMHKTAGIQIGGSGTTLTIRGDGSLTATGGSQAAGIGLGRTWDASVTAGVIVIEGGTVNASGDIGIGIGTVGNSQTATIDGISIKGGTVSASLGKGYIYNGCTATVGYIKIYDTIDMVDASKITESVTYMHDDTDVTASASDYFTIIENGNRRIIVPKDDTDYTITIADGIEHGTLTVAETAKYMETVTVTATPAFGYRFVRLIVKDAQNNDVASTGNTFQMPKGGATVSAVFEQGTHGTTEFVWGYPGPDSFVNEATIYDGVTTVNIQNTEVSYNILKNEEYTYSKFLLDNNTYDANIPYAGGTGEFVSTNGTNFNVPYNGQTGYYDVTLTDVGNGKWGVSILPTPAQMDVVPDQTYTGSAITPEPLVIAGSLSLTKGTDYVYSYTNNTNVGTATVRATFQGDYESLGSVEKTFTIMPDWTYNTEGGYYEISDADDLNALATYVNAGIDASGKTFKQTADIDMQGVTFTPIGNDEGTHMFRGTYDGDGYFILNISHSISGTNELSGLFGDLRGTVKNVNLKDCNFSAYRVGAIAGQTGDDCLIQNCNVIGGTITGTDNSPHDTHGSYMGGIVGYFYDKTATNCFSTASFGGDAYHKGPVVGWNGGTVTDCYYVNTPGGNSDGTQVTVYDITLGDGITISGNFRTVGRTAANTYYFGKENDAITLSNSATAAPQGYQYGYTASAGTLSGTTLTMPDEDVTINTTLRSDGQQHKVNYIKADGTTGEASAIALDGHETVNSYGEVHLSAGGTYYVGTDIAYVNRIMPEGDVTLILADGKTMTLNGNTQGIDGYNLTIYGQSLDYATAGTLRYDGILDGIHAYYYEQHSGNVRITTTGSAVNGIIADNVTLRGGTLTVSANGDNAFAIDGTTHSILGGHLTATGTGAGATGIRALADDCTALTLGWNRPADRITASSISTGGGTVAVKDGQALTDGSGNIYTGTLSADDLTALGGQTLQPCLVLNETAGVTPLAALAGQANVPVMFTRSGLATNAYSTMCLPFGFDKPNNCTFYEFKGVGWSTANNQWEATISETSTLAAHTPYIFKCSDTEATFIGTIANVPDNIEASLVEVGASEGDDQAWKFKGTYTALDWKSADPSEPTYGFSTYVPVEQGNTENIAAGTFVRFVQGASLAPFRARLIYSGSDTHLNARAHSRAAQAEGELPRYIIVRIIGANGSATAIGTLDTATGQLSTDEWYTLGGRRLEAKPSAKGIYIHNGKKVAIK